MGINSGEKKSRSEQLILGPRRAIAELSPDSAVPFGDAGWDVSEYDQVVVVITGSDTGSAKAQVWRRFRVDEATAGKLENIWAVGDYFAVVSLADTDGTNANQGTFLVNTLGCDRLQVTIPELTRSGVGQDPFFVYVAAFGGAPVSGVPLASTTASAGGGEQEVDLIKIGGNTAAAGGVNGALVVTGDKGDGAELTASYPVKVGAVADNIVSAVDDGDVVHLVTDLNRRLRTVVDNTVSENLAQIGGETVAGAGVNGMLAAGGDVADDSAASASYPVKGGAVADETVSAVSDGDLVHFVTDIYRRLRVVSAAYDSTAESDKVSVENTEAADHDEKETEVADATNQNTGTTNYPSDDGLEVGDRANLSFVLTLLDVTSVAFQCSNDRSVWVDQTEDVMESGAMLHDKTYFTAAGEATYYAPKWSCGWRYFRCAVAVPNATNTVKISVYQRALV